MPPPIFADGLSWPAWLEHVANQSPTLVCLMMMVGILFRYMKKQHKENLKSKDAEIERLCEEKKELQRRLFDGPLRSTTDDEPETGHGQGDSKQKESAKKGEVKGQQQNRRDKKGGKR